MEAPLVLGRNQSLVRPDIIEANDKAEVSENLKSDFGNFIKELDRNYAIINDLAKSVALLGTMVKEIENAKSARLKGGQLNPQTNQAQERLRKKLALRKKEQGDASIENLNSGIELIKRKMEQQEAEKALQLKAQASDLMMKQILEEEKDAKRKQALKPSISPSTQKKKIKRKRSPTPEANQSASTQVIDHVAKPASSTVKPAVRKAPRLSYKEKLAKFALNLCQGPLQIVEEPRVRRWRTKNIEKIRLFKDKDRFGQLIFRYQDLDNEEILKQRMRHFLPGTERLLKDPYRSIYAFRTDRGYGFVARLIYQGEVHDGVLYIGMDKANKIYHKYFEDMDFGDPRQDVFKDVEDRVFDFEDKGEDSEEEWQSPQSDFNIDMSNDGVFAFFYSDYEIKVFPLQKELFNKKVSRLK